MSHVPASFYVEEGTLVLQEFVKAVSPNLRTVTDSHNVQSPQNINSQA